MLPAAGRKLAWDLRWPAVSEGLGGAGRRVRRGRECVPGRCGLDFAGFAGLGTSGEKGGREMTCGIDSS